MNAELLGLTTIQCARVIVDRHPEIETLIFRAYDYVPNQASLVEPKFEVGRDTILNGFDPNTLTRNLNENYNIALDSTVRTTRNTDAYLLMVDLSPSKSAVNQAKIEDQFKTHIVPFFGGGFLSAKAKYHGFISGWMLLSAKRSASSFRCEAVLRRYHGFSRGASLDTRRSYHYLGLEITDQAAWFDFLGRCLISSIVTKTPDDQPNIHELMADYRYIGYSILRRSTGLRVTARGKKIVVPKSIAVL